MRIMNDNTENANYIISRDFSNKNIVFIGEYLSHDGYDKYGAQSNLWDLYIIEECEDNFLFYDYHWEDWFSKYDTREYELCKTKNLEDCSLNDFQIIMKSKITSTKLDNIVKNLYNSKLKSVKINK